MAKPILVIRMTRQAKDSFERISKAVRKQMQDEYHVLMVGEEMNFFEIKFEVLNVDKEPEIKYSELKKLINKEIEEAPHTGVIID